MQKHEVIALCNSVRSKLEDVRLTHKKVGFESLQDFPVACCKITSLAMMYYLSRIKGIPKDDLVLLANAKIGDCSHAWSKYRNLHIDLTGDQFNNCPYQKFHPSLIADQHHVFCVDSWH